MPNPLLNGLRGIAILAILLNIWWPLAFPNGTLGLDIFFVITGYSINIYFSDIKESSWKTIGRFYYKSLKRIFPLYYPVIFATIVISQFLVAQVWLGRNNDNALYSLLFIKNLRAIWESEEYNPPLVPLVVQHDIYHHTWALAVVIQFYLIAPFLYFCLLNLGKPVLKLTLLTTIFVLSLLAQNSTSAPFALNHIFARLWQFILGIMAHRVAKRLQTIPTKASPKENESKWWLTCAGFMALSGLLFLTFPTQFDNMFLQLLLSLSISVLLILEKDYIPKILFNKCLNYIGTISFLLYMISWPIAVIVGIHNWHQVQLSIVLVVVCSTVIHNCYEKFYLRMKPNAIIIIVLLFLVLNATFLHSFGYSPRIQNLVSEYKLNSASPVVKGAIESNLKLLNVPYDKDLDCQFNKSTPELARYSYPWGLCHFPAGTGNQSVLLIGNGLAVNQANIIRAELKSKYSSFALFSDKNLQVLYNHPNPSYNDEISNRLGRRIIAELEPDVVFIAASVSPTQKSGIPNGVKNDRVVRQQNNIVKFIERNCRKLFIQGPQPVYHPNHLNYFTEALETGAARTNFHLTKKKTDRELRFARQRFVAINCTKCEVYDTAKPFVRGSVYLGFHLQTLVSFVDNRMHFTPNGLQLIRPVYRNIIKRL